MTSYYDYVRVTHQDTPLVDDFETGNYSASVTIEKQPDHGTLDFQSPAFNPKFTYTPRAGFYGADTFEALVNFRGQTIYERQIIRVLPNSDSVPVDTVSIGGIPDTMGAVGPNSTVEVTNDSYTVRDKAGSLLKRTTLDDFWNSALAGDRQVSETQEFHFSGSIVLSYGPLNSQRIDWSNDSSVLLSRFQSALDTMLGAGNTKALMADYGINTPALIDVVFCGQLADTPMQQLTIRSLSPKLEFQGNPTGGSFTLTFALGTGTVTTAPIPYSQTIQSSNIQQALDRALGLSKATVTTLSGSPFLCVIKFSANLDSPSMAVDDRALVGGTIITYVDDNSRSNELQNLSFTGAPSGGTFTLKLHVFDHYGSLDGFIDDHVTLTTAPIAYSTNPDETAAAIQTALTAPAVLGEGNAVVIAVSPYEFNVTFGGEFGPFANPASITISADASQLTGGTSPTIATTLVRAAGTNREAEYSVRTLMHGTGDEVQRLAVAGSAPAGWFVLGYAPGMVQSIAWSDDQSVFLGRLQKGLDAMFGAGNTKVLETADGQFDIAFCGQLGGAGISTLLVLETPAGVTTQISELEAGAGNEVQRLSLDTGVTGGTFRISYGPALSSMVAWTSDYRELLNRIQQALNQMFGSDSVHVLPADASANQFDITFCGSLADTRLMPLQVTTSLAGGAARLWTVAEGSGNEVQRLSFSGAISSGTVRLSFSDQKASFPWSADPATLAGSLQTALDGMFGVGNTRSFAVGGNQFDIIFQGQYGGLDLPLISLLDTNESQQITFTGSPDSAFFTIALPLPSGTIETDLIPYIPANPQQTADMIIRRLEDALAPFNGVVNCTSVSSSVFNVTISGGLAGANLPNVMLRITDVTPPTAVLSATSTTVIDGSLNGGGTVQLTAVDDGGGNLVDQLSPPMPFSDGSSVKLSFGSINNLLMTRTLNYTSDQAAMRARLEAAMTSIFGEGNAAVLNGYGSSFDFVFTGQLAHARPTSLESNLFVSDGSHSFGTISRTGPNVSVLHAEDSRIVFDQRSGRWFAMSMFIPQTSLPFINLQSYDASMIAIAVSNSSNPLDGWKAIFVDPDPSRLHNSDFPKLGVDADGVYVSVRELDNEMDDVESVPSGGVVVISIPKSDLVGETPTAAHATISAIFSDSASAGPLFDMQPSVDFGAPDGRESLIGLGFGGPARSDVVLAPQTPGHDTIDPRIDMTGPSLTGAPSAPQVGTPIAIDSDVGLTSSAVVRQGNSFWLAFVAGVQGRAGVRWMEIDATTNTVKQWGDIGGRPSDGDLAFTYPSIAVNAVGDVVIGFTGSSPTQHLGAYYVVGQTANGVTTFGDAQLAAPGTGVWDGNRWGDFSATVTDPSDQDDFWTFQEYAAFDHAWGITIDKVSTAPSNRPLAASDTYETNEDAPLSVASNAGVLANDSGAPTDSLIAQLVQQPAHGTLSLSPDGSFVYVPSDNFSGADTFTYYAVSGAVISRTATVTVQVHPVNDAPAGADVTISTHRNATYVFSRADFFFADTRDTPANHLSAVRIVSPPAAGTLIRNGDVVGAGDYITAADLDSGKLRFAPAHNAHTSPYCSIVFEVQDDGGTADGGADLSVPQTVTINVLDVSAWHNLENPFDVNGDSAIAPDDALLIINYINAKAPSAIPLNPLLGPPYYDVTDDDFIAPNDALAVINYLNAFGSSEGEASDPAATVNPQTPSEDLLAMLALDIASQPRRRRG